MAKELNSRIGVFNTDKLVADPRLEMVTHDMTLGTNATVSRGQIVVYDATTKTVKGITAKSEADQIFGIARHDAKYSDGDLNVNVYITGKFNAEAVAAANTGITLSDLVLPLRKLGILIAGLQE